MATNHIRIEKSRFACPCCGRDYDLERDFGGVEVLLSCPKPDCVNQFLGSGRTEHEANLDMESKIEACPTIEF